MSVKKMVINYFKILLSLLGDMRLGIYANEWPSTVFVSIPKSIGLPSVCPDDLLATGSISGI